MESKFEDNPGYSNYVVELEYPVEEIGVCLVERHERNLIRYNTYSKIWHTAVYEYSLKTWKQVV